MKETDELLTVQEVASRLALKPSTIRKMIAERRIDVVRPSRRAVRIPRSSILRIVEKGFRPAIQVSKAEGEAEGIPN